MRRKKNILVILVTKIHATSHLMSYLTCIIVIIVDIRYDYVNLVLVTLRPSDSDHPEFLMQINNTDVKHQLWGR